MNLASKRIGPCEQHLHNLGHLFKASLAELVNDKLAKVISNTLIFLLQKCE